jgi:hypothetical protein
MSDSYINVNSLVMPKNYTISLGVGLPMRNSGSVVNAAIEYGKIGATNILSENFLKFTFNITFNEHWFIKRKL